jgi:hypothetical protein
MCPNHGQACESGSSWLWVGDGERQHVQKRWQPSDRVVAVRGQELAEFIVDSRAGSFGQTRLLAVRQPSFWHRCRLTAAGLPNLLLNPHRWDLDPSPWPEAAPAVQTHHTPYVDRRSAAPYFVRGPCSAVHTNWQLSAAWHCGAWLDEQPQLPRCPFRSSLRTSMPLSWRPQGRSG